MRQALQRIVSTKETIVAISTPLGRSGIGVIRLSGPAAVAIAQRFFIATSSDAGFEHRRAQVGRWFSENGDRVDDVVVTFFQAPQSYTGEDVIEISGHGNPLSLAQIVHTA